MTSLPLRPEPTLTDGDFRTIAAALRRETGITLPAGKRPLVVSRLARRLRQLKLKDFSEYTSLISRPDGEAELSEMVSALTTNVTAFFRESHHFDTLRDLVLPPLVAQARKGGRIRLWSAACSSGEEAFSAAMVLLDLFPEAAQSNLRILATDIDPAILTVARDGKYPVQSVATIPAPYRDRWMKRESDKLYRISPALAQLVTFRRMNLTGDWPFKYRFDAVFCRNVAIYFDHAVQDQLWEKMARQLTPQGYLFIGHSERITGPATRLLRQQGITTYRRIANEGLS